MHRTTVALVMLWAMTGVAVSEMKETVPISTPASESRAIEQRSAAGPALEEVNPGSPPWVETDAWGDPYQLTTNGSSQYTGFAYQNTIAVDTAGNVHVVWYDYRSSPYPIYYRKWVKATGTWDPETALAQHGTASYYRPAVACDYSGNVHVAWYASTSGYYGIYYKKWNVATQTWGNDTLLHSPGGSFLQYYPSVACRPGGDNVHVAWYGYPVGGGSYYRIWHKEYVPATGWGVSTMINTVTTYSATSAGVAADSANDVYVTFVQRDASNTYNKVWCLRRVSGVWQTEEQVTTAAHSTYYQYDPDVVVYRNGEPHVVWYGYSSTNPSYNQIYWRQRTSGGWGSCDTVSDMRTAVHYYPAVALYKDTLTVIWRSYGGGSYYQIFSRQRCAGTWNSVQQATNRNTGTIYYMGAIADRENSVHVLFYDTYSGNNDPWYLRRSRDYSYDAGVVQVRAPLGNVSPRGGIVPRALVKNYGLQNLGSFAVRCTIYNMAGTARYSNQQTVTSLNAGDTVQVTFSTYTATNYESVLVAVRTAYVGDQDPGNDMRTGNAVVFRPYYTGGPDSSNYYWIDSDTTGGPVYDWIDIRATGTDVPFPSYDDAIARIPIGFSFRYYGNTYSRLTVGTNGAISFDSVAIPLSNDSMPRTATPNNLVAALWDDLHCMRAGKVKYKVLGTTPNCTLVVSYDSIRYFLGYDSTLAFQFLFRQGPRDIIMQYKNVATGYPNRDYGYSATVGVENAYGSHGLDYAYGAGTRISPLGNMLTNGRAVRFHTIIHDVGSTKLERPTGLADSGQTVVPACSAYNYGNQVEAYYVKMTISPGYSESTLVSGHEPGTYVYVQFPSWTPVIRGNYTTVCSTKAAGDIDPSNDRKSGFGFVRVRDVAASMFGEPAPGGIYPAGSIIYPYATWRNNGNVVAAFDAWMLMNDAAGSRVYSNRAGIPSLAAGTSVLVTLFPPCTVSTGGQWAFRCSTGYVGDQVADNDTLDGDFMAGNPDIGVAQIEEPAGHVDTNEVVTPRARIHNYGDCVVRFKAWFEMYDPTDALVYTDSLDGIVLQMGADTALSFTPFNVGTLEGGWATRCSVRTAGDVEADNDCLDGTFTVSSRPPWPLGWDEVTPMPSGLKAAKDGAWLATGAEGALIYAARGNKVGDFYSYEAIESTWTPLTVIPNGTEAKPPYKGAAGCVAGSFVYATKGNGTSGFWRYNIDSLTWTQFPDVPLGPSGKKVKGGTDMVYVVENDTGYVYLLKGVKQDFFRFNTVSGVWDTSLPAAPAGANPKWDKGSWVAFNPQPEPPGVPLIYAHKAKYHELWTFDVTTHAWATAALPGMPLVGSMGKSKKSKDGGCAAYYSGALYALKGGNTQEFWKFTIATNAWAELETMPAFGSTAKKKRVKAGGDIVSFGGGVFFALKGNKTNELWRYVASEASMLNRPCRDGVAGVPAPGASHVRIAPNPLSGRLATLSYSLPQAGPVTIRVYDVTGRTVLSATLAAARSGSAPLDLRALSAGVYLVRLQALGVSTAQKLIVQ